MKKPKRLLMNNLEEKLIMKKVLIISTICLTLILITTLVLFYPRKLKNYLDIDANEIKSVKITVFGMPGDDVKSRSYRLYENFDELINKTLEVKVKPKYIHYKTQILPYVEISFEYNDKVYEITSAYIKVDDKIIRYKHQEEIYYIVSVRIHKYPLVPLD